MFKVKPLPMRREIKKKNVYKIKKIKMELPHDLITKLAHTENRTLKLIIYGTDFVY